VVQRAEEGTLYELAFCIAMNSFSTHAQVHTPFLSSLPEYFPQVVQSYEKALHEKGCPLHFIYSQKVLRQDYRDSIQPIPSYVTAALVGKELAAGTIGGRGRWPIPAQNESSVVIPNQSHVPDSGEPCILVQDSSHEDGSKNYAHNASSLTSIEKQEPPRHSAQSC